eukprot:611159-Amphidinium_carterae.1
MLMARRLAVGLLTGHLAAAESGMLDYLTGEYFTGVGSDFLERHSAPAEAELAQVDADEEARPKWDALKSLLDGWEFTQNYAIAVGTPAGRVFLYEGGNFTMETLIPTGSTSKWPSAMMFAGLVSDGTVKSLDDPVHKYVPWWTKDPKDMRSTVTFRMLLDFTSGFGDGKP